MRARRRGTYSSMGYAFSCTLAAAAYVVSGLIGYRLSGPDRALFGTHWSNDCIWSQVWIGVALACVAAWFWRKGMREIRSNAIVPELAGHDPSAPPSRRIERQ